jgi:hypothetical protein
VQLARGRTRTRAGTTTSPARAARRRQTMPRSIGHAGRLATAGPGPYEAVVQDGEALRSRKVTLAFA